MKLGKQPFKFDKRTAKMADFVDPSIRAPVKFDFDKGRSAFPHNMWGNDEYGDCVLADQMNHLLRFERTETRHTLKAKDEDVISQYLKLTGGKDEGLVMLDSFNWWRHSGWNIKGKNYTIDGFGGLPPADQQKLKLACYLLHGIDFGFSLPISAQRQTREGYWDVVEGPEGEPGSWGGHAVYCKRYDADNFYVITWGTEIRVTNAFVAQYCDEAWAVVDSLDTWRKHPAFDVQQFEQYLDEIGVSRQ